MGLLKYLMGSDKDEIWGQIAKDIGGEYIDGGFWEQDVLRYRAGEWELTLDTYSVSSGKSSTTYTGMRAPFVNKDGLYFKLYREGFFSSVGKFFGMQDLQIGEPDFDRAFVIKGNHADKLKLLLNDADLRTLILAQADISFEIVDSEGLFGAKYPDGVDLLRFQCYGILEDPVRLRQLFDLFTLTLQRLVRIDSAYESDPKIRL